MELNDIVHMLNACEQRLHARIRNGGVTVTLDGCDDARVRLVPDGGSIAGTLLRRNPHVADGWEVLEAKWDRFDLSADGLRRCAHAARVELSDLASEVR